MILPPTALNLLFTTIIVVDKTTNNRISDATITVKDKKGKKVVQTAKTLKNGQASIFIANLKKDNVSENIEVSVTAPNFKSDKITIKTYKPSTFTVSLKPIKSKPKDDGTGTGTDDKAPDELYTERLPIEDKNNKTIEDKDRDKDKDKDGGKNKKMWLYFGLGAVALSLSIFLLIKATSAKKPPVIGSNV